MAGGVRPLTFQIQPIELVPTPGTVTGGNSFSLQVTVNQAPTSDTPVQIDCADHSLLNPPGGGSWPYSLTVPANATQVTMTVGTNSVGTLTNVQLRGGPNGVDMSQSSNWTATKLVAVVAQR